MNIYIYIRKIATKLRIPVITCTSANMPFGGLLKWWTFFAYTIRRLPFTAGLVEADTSIRSLKRDNCLVYRQLFGIICRDESSATKHAKKKRRLSCNRKTSETNSIGVTCVQLESTSPSVPLLQQSWIQTPPAPNIIYLFCNKLLDSHIYWCHAWDDNLFPASCQIHQYTVMRLFIHWAAEAKRMCLISDIGDAVSQTGETTTTWVLFQNATARCIATLAWYAWGDRTMLLTDGASCCPKMCDVVGILHAPVNHSTGQFAM